MSKKEKLIKRFLSKPKDFTFDELKSLLKYFDYELDESGDGSRVRFISKVDQDVINIHKPHPRNIVKLYAINYVNDKLTERGLI